MERPKATYRTAALSALGSALIHLKGNFFAKVSPPLLKAIEGAQSTDSKVSVNSSGTQTGSPQSQSCDFDRRLCRATGVFSTSGLSAMGPHAAECGRRGGSGKAAATGGLPENPSSGLGGCG